MDHKFLSNIENYKIDEDPGPFSKNNELRKLGYFKSLEKSVNNIYRNEKSTFSSSTRRNI